MDAHGHHVEVACAERAGRGAAVPREEGAAPPGSVATGRAMPLDRD
jgi:hypothetical protein